MLSFDEWRARSPFYDETHDAVARSVARFVEREVAPHIDRWEAEGELPRALHAKAAQAGILQLGFPEEYGGLSEGFDIFHGFTQAEELAKPGAGGLHASLLTHSMALPPVLHLGSDDLKRRIAPPVLAGEKLMALAISEPSGGSDVAALKTSARRVGDRYVLNGSKTFITSGMRADYFTVAVRTGGPGMGGISLLLVEADSPGFTRTKLDKMGWRCSDTATLYFDEVEVPAENLIGPENEGFLRIVQNFNDERLLMAMQCCAHSRVCLCEAAQWALTRETFGKRLVDHQTIRVKLANIALMIEGTQAWVDQCAWMRREGRLTPASAAMLKVQATRTLELAAREAAQVLGGASYITGFKVERIYREVRVNAIGGGSEEIMLDLAGRQLFR